MLISMLTNTSMTLGEKLVYTLIIAFCVLLSLTVHEVSHGLAANVMGDKTAEYYGRLSLNPMHHLDPFGALCLFLFGFGWARPVPIDPRNFKHKKAGTVVTSLAGPFSNFLLAFFAQLGVVILGGISFKSDTSVLFRLATVTYMICYYLASVNIGLGLFNLIPIPPLDGSKVLTAVLPARIYFKLMQYERYGFVILIILINLPVFDNILLLCRSGILSFYSSIIGIFIH